MPATPAASSTSEPLTVQAAASLFMGQGSARADNPTPAKPTAPAIEQHDEDDVLDDDALEPNASIDDQTEPVIENEAEPAEEQEPAPEQADDPLVTVTIDGKAEQIPLSEALKGYQRTADYTRKTQQTAEQRKAAERELAEARAARTQLTQEIAQLQEVMQSLRPQEPEWDKLRAEDPIGYVEAYADWQRMEASQKQVSERHQALLRQQQEDQLKELEAVQAAEQQKLLDAIPSWKKNPELAKRESRELFEFAVKTYGAKPEDLAAVTDHRFFLMMRESMLYRKLQAAKPAPRPTTTNTRTLTPGQPAATKSRAVQEFERANRRLAQTGDVADAAAVFLQAAMARKKR